MSGIEAGLTALRMTAIEQRCYHVRSDQLVQVAVDALVAGVDSPSLAELAGLGRTEGGAPQLFAQVIAELRLTVPATDAECRWALARRWADRIVDGLLDPLEGAGLIWYWVASELRYPDELQAFVRAASEADDWYEGWPGPSMDQLRRDALQAAKALAALTA